LATIPSAKEIENGKLFVQVNHLVTQFTN